MMRSLIGDGWHQFVLASGFVAVACLGLGSVADAGVVLYYDFENDSTAAGDVNDQSGNSRDGSTFVDGAQGGGPGSGSAGFEADTPGGFAGTTSLALSGDNNNATNSGWVDSDTPGFTGVAGSADRTLSAWIRADAIDQDQVIAAYGDTPVDGNKFTFRLDESGTSGNYFLRLEIDGSSLTAATTVLNDGAWHHVAVVIDESEATNVLLYVDGSLETSGTLTLSTAATSNFRIGAEGPNAGGSSGERNFNGNIDDVALFDMALSLSQIESLADGSQTPLTVIPEPYGLSMILTGVVLGVIRRRRKS